jgi:hypothetical protein
MNEFLMDGDSLFATKESVLMFGSRDHFHAPHSTHPIREHIDVLADTVG